MSISPNYQQTIDFLKGFHPNSWWVLSAIPVAGDPVNKSIPTETFDPKDEKGVKEWLLRFGGDHNLYFVVGQTINPMNKRPRRDDVKSIRWLHVDVDPDPIPDKDTNKQEWLESEQKRILNLLRNPPGNLPDPTIIVFSGGGYQAYWKLKVPLAIHGILDRAIDAGRYNLQIERLFNADSCHSIDHIMRLPGTLNRPDEKKIAKGRTKQLAKIIEWNKNSEYDIKLFTKAQEVQTSKGGAFVGHRKVVEVSGNIPRLNDIDDLPESIPETVKATIVNGEHPTEPERHQSRSEALWWVVCELTRQRIEPDIIYSIITDPGFKISESVLDKKYGAHNYALKQINDAAEKAISPDLHYMNNKYAAIKNYGGFCIIYEEIEHSLSRMILKRCSPGDIKNYYNNRKVEIGEDKDGNKKHAPLGAWWLTHTNRRQYEGLVFMPGQETPDGFYNLWQGFAVAQIPGTKHETFLDHLKNNLCQRDAEKYNYLIKWMAYAVQHPDQPGHVAIVMRGKKGVGKSFAANIFGNLFGRHYMSVTNPRHLIGNFNSHLRDVVVLFADEAFYAGDKKHESILKTLITEQTMVVEAKGIDATIATNCIHLMVASNQEWSIPASWGERRFFVLDVSDEHVKDTSYFSEIQGNLETGGYESLLHYLQSIDLSDFNVRNAPFTEGLKDQILYSMDNEIEWWFSKLTEGSIIDEDGDWPDKVWKLLLYSDYLNYSRATGTAKRANQTKFGMLLKKMIPDFKQIKSREERTIRLPNGQEETHNRIRYVIIPDLQTCRSHFEKVSGNKINWEKIEPIKQKEIDLF